MNHGEDRNSWVHTSNKSVSFLSTAKCQQPSNKRGESTGGRKPSFCNHHRKDWIRQKSMEAQLLINYKRGKNIAKKWDKTLAGWSKLQPPTRDGPPMPPGVMPQCRWFSWDLAWALNKSQINTQWRKVLPVTLALAVSSCYSWIKFKLHQWV